jgi:heme-degrading monooxygenase HmoA
MAMADLWVTMRFKLKSDRVAEFEASMKAMLVETTRRPGFVAISILRGIEPSEVMLIAVWKTRADQENYVNWRIERGDFQQLAATFAEDPVTEFWPEPIAFA